MKNILLIALILLSNNFFGQVAFEKFDNQENITGVSVNKKMFELMSKVKIETSDKETQQYMSLIKDLDNLKVYITTNVKAASEMKTTSEKFLKSSNLDELMRVTDNGRNVKIFVKTGSTETKIKELFMFIEGSGKENQTVIMSLTGDFSLNQLSALTNKMHLPGGDILKKVSNSKN